MNFSSKTITKLATLAMCAVLMFATVAVSAQNEQTDGVSGSPAIPGDIPDVFQSFIFTGTLDGTDPTRSDRLNRNTVVHSCAIPKTCSIFAPGSFPYDEHVFVNPDVQNTVCVDVVLRGMCTDGNIDVTAYDGSFNPTSICNNWMADPGFSSGTPAADLPMSLEIAPGQTVVFVVSTPNNGGTCMTGGGYELEVSGDFDLTALPTVPTMGEWGLISLGMILMIFGVVAVGQRKSAMA